MIWLHATSGRGPEECCLALKGIVAAIISEANTNGLTCSILECQTSRHGLYSALLCLEGPTEREFVSRITGTHLWLCKSPLRPNHGRKRWFVGFKPIEPLQDGDTSIQPSDCEWATMKASGPGGQHVNKTESAVRLTHRPTGIVVTAQEERSQHRNKALALAKLKIEIATQQAAKIAGNTQTQWDAHNGLERGDPIRTYEGPYFSLKS